MHLSEPNSQALPAGTQIEEFLIERVLGSGGFGITYLAQDTSLGRKVVIKENLPIQFVFRDPGSLTVAPRHSQGEDHDNFLWSLDNFSREAAMLASIDHAGIVRVLRSFQMFGTAYFVMPFVEGHSFDHVIAAREAAGDPFSEEELVEMLECLLGAFAYLHERGIYHRDVKPGNILMTATGEPVLIDFGAARQLIGEMSMTIIESPGYTPFEQTESRGNVGAWSDLYALGGVMRKAITFQTPARSADRIRRDPMADLADSPEWTARFSPAFLRAIDRALRVNEEDRWQSAEDWLEALRDPEALSGDPVGTAVKRRENPGRPGPKDTARKERGGRTKPPVGKKPATGPGAARNRMLKRILVPVVLLAAASTAAVTYRADLESQWKKFAASWLRRESPVPVSPMPGRSLTLEESVGNLFEEPEVPPKPKVPDSTDWERLAGEGDAFAQALLGERLLSRPGASPSEQGRGMEWLKTAAAANHPLALFLLAEQEQEAGPPSTSASGAANDPGGKFRDAFERGFEAEAKDGGAVWQAALGRAYLRGLGIATDEDVALRWLSLAGQGGHVESQYLAGEIHERGGISRARIEDAAKWYLMAAESGLPAAQAAMARLSAKGVGTPRNEKKAYEWATLAADADDLVGLATLAEFHENGTGLDRSNVFEAHRLYQKAAKAGSTVAKGSLGRMYAEGKVVDPKGGEALRLLKEAVDEGDKNACRYLGLLFETGREGASEDVSAAVKYYQMGHERGDPEASLALAICMEEGRGIPAAPEKALEFYRKAAAGEIKEAQVRLGVKLLEDGRSDPGKSEASKWLRKAATGGPPVARYHWGRCLEKGIGTPKDEASALREFQAASQGGIVEAGYRSGLLLEEGRGTKKNEAAAVGCYRAAAEAGNVDAQVNLGIMLGQGRGTAKDDAEAVRWYRRAAEQGDAHGLMLLGMMQEFGHGTPQDLDAAAECYEKAARKGAPGAMELLKNIKP